jgi:hypothetical protein
MGWLENLLSEPAAPADETHRAAGARARAPTGQPAHPPKRPPRPQSHNGPRPKSSSARSPTTRTPPTCSTARSQAGRRTLAGSARPSQPARKKTWLGPPSLSPTHDRPTPPSPTPAQPRPPFHAIPAPSRCPAAGPPKLALSYQGLALVRISWIRRQSGSRRIHDLEIVSYASHIPRSCFYATTVQARSEVGA